VFLLPDCESPLSKTSRSRTYHHAVPDTAKFLTDRERIFIQARLPPNAPRASEADFNVREIYDALRDKRLWLFTLIWATFTVGTSGVRLPTDCHRQPRLHQHCTSAITQPANLSSCDRSHRRHRLLYRQCQTPPASIPARHLRGHHRLLRRAGRLSIQRSRIRCNSHRQRMHRSLLPAHVAMASTDDVSRNRKRFLYRLCEQLRADWRRHRSAGLQVQVRS
jgi:hypothetical protein